MVSDIVVAAVTGFVAAAAVVVVAAVLAVLVTVMAVVSVAVDAGLEATVATVTCNGFEIKYLF